MTVTSSAGSWSLRAIDRTYWIAVRRIQIVAVDTTDSVAVPYGVVVKGLVHQFGHLVVYQMGKLLESDDEGSPNEAPPVGVPSVVHLWRISGSTDRWLLWVFLIRAVPGHLYIYLLVNGVKWQTVACMQV